MHTEAGSLSAPNRKYTNEGQSPKTFFSFYGCCCLTCHQRSTHQTCLRNQTQKLQLSEKKIPSPTHWLICMSQNRFVMCVFYLFLWVLNWTPMQSHTAACFLVCVLTGRLHGRALSCSLCFLCVSLCAFVCPSNSSWVKLICIKKQSLQLKALYSGSYHKKKTLVT